MSETTTQFHGTLCLHFESALLVGGYRTPSGFADTATALDSQGQAYLPASALKGALREACTRLLRERGDNCCDITAPCGSTERTSEFATEGQELPSGYCLVCELFGATGIEGVGFAHDAEDRRPSATEGTPGLVGGLRVRDAVLDGAAEERLRLQPGVTLDSTRGAATPGLLFLKEVFDPPERPVTVPISARVSRAAWDLLRDAVPLLTAVGAGRSRGLGRLCVVFEEPAAPPCAPPSIICVETLDESAIVDIEAVEPLSVGGRPTSGSWLPSLHHLPGGAIRASIAAALVEGGVSRDDVVLRAAFQDEGDARLRFSDALPVSPSWHEKLDLPLPCSASLLACKNRDCKGVIRDTLLTGALAVRLLAAGGTWEPPRCPKCDDDLTTAEGIFPKTELRHRFVTRVGLDPRTGSAMPGMLYTVELLEQKSRFVGTVAGLSKELVDLLSKAGPIRIGRGRSRGQGLVQVRLRRPGSNTGLTALASRQAEFVRAARSLLSLARRLGAGDLPEDVRQLVPVLLRTDMAPQVSLEKLPDVLAEAALGHGARVFSAHQRNGERYGFSLGFDQDARTYGPRPVQPVARAGSIYLLQGVKPPELERLARVEAQGLGEQRHLGLGQLQFYPRTVLLGLPQE